MAICEDCGKEFDAADGAWDNGDYLCGECIAKYIEESEKKRRSDRPRLETPLPTPKK